MHNIFCHPAYNTIYLTCRHRLLNFLAYSMHSEKMFFYVGVLFIQQHLFVSKNNLSNPRIRNCVGLREAAAVTSAVVGGCREVSCVLLDVAVAVADPAVI